MSKEVILMAKVDGLGSEGEVVKVADGYARNYLLPRKLAAPVSEVTRRQLEKKKEQREVASAREREGAEQLAAKLDGVSCTIPVKTGPEGKMFGSVSTADIAATLAGEGIEIDKKQIDLKSPLKELGVFKIDVNLHDDIQATLKVWVVEE